MLVTAIHVSIYLFFVGFVARISEAKRSDACNV